MEDMVVDGPQLYGVLGRGSQGTVGLGCGWAGCAHC
jgi:hypothetical protein